MTSQSKASKIIGGNINYFVIAISFLSINYFKNLIPRDAKFESKVVQILNKSLEIEIPQKSFVCPTIRDNLNVNKPSSKFTGESNQFPTLLPAPFSDELKAIKERNGIKDDRISMKMALSGNYDRPIRIYTDGIYDLFHAGHGYQLMQAKNLFKNVYLIAGVCNDSITHQLKGCTIMGDDDRYDSVRNCRYVDEVVRNAPWEITMNYLEYHKIDFVVHGEDPNAKNAETSEWDEIYAKVKSRDMYIETKRPPGLSTSAILNRILVNRHIYEKRNHARGFKLEN